MTIFNSQFLYTTYADDTSFPLSSENPVTFFPRFMPNKSKCEIGSIGVLKGDQMALCDMECVNLKTNAIKILAMYFFM